MKITTVVGARPQFIKLAPLFRAFEGTVEQAVIHTGQHYDPSLSKQFFEEFGLPKPTADLEVGSFSHGKQTAKMLEGIENELRAALPDGVVVFGDTNSTLAGALAAAKLEIPIFHVEAGLRSNNHRMPEEINRIVADHLSEICFAPSDVAAQNLVKEGLGARSQTLGDVMVDAFADTLLRVRQTPPELPWRLDKEFSLVSLHRQELMQSPEKLREIIAGLENVKPRVKLIAHPRLSRRLSELGIDVTRLEIFPPLAHNQTVAALHAAKVVITDSGGLQKEAFLARVPCITLRTETEWPETIEFGWNTLLYSNFKELPSLVKATKRGRPADPYGKRGASHRIAHAIREALGRRL